MLNRFWNNRKPLPTIFLLSATAILLSGCGFKWPQWATIDSDPLFFLGSEEQESNTPPPPNVIPEDEPDQNALQPEFLPSSTMGLNLKTYFAQDIQDPTTRMQRLENALVAIHQDLQNIQPTNAIPAGVAQNTATHAPQQIYAQATSITAAPAPTQTPPAATTPPTQAPSQNYAAPANGKKVDPGSWLADHPSTGQILATGIRVGAHGNKVRIVFDVTKQTKFTADLDNNEHLLVVELPEAAWRAPNNAKFPKIALFESYKVDSFNGGAGSIAIIQLKKGSQILKQQQIPALSGSGKRIYIDLAK